MFSSSKHKQYEYSAMNNIYVATGGRCDSFRFFSRLCFESSLYRCIMGYKMFPKVAN